jgi:hypothetical protein
MKFFLKTSLLLLAVASTQAYNLLQKPDQSASRRAIFQNVAAVAAAGSLAILSPSPALASGGATAGKYT